MLKFIRTSSVGSILEVSANFLTVVGGAVGLYAVTHPETIATYLNRIDNKVDIIAESIPLWPVIDGFQTFFSPPTNAGVSIRISNPKNLVVNDFLVKVSLDIDGERRIFDLNGPGLLPPNEVVAFSRNIIRESWFMSVSNADEVKLNLCMSGSLEGSSAVFYEGRVYTFSFSQNSPILRDRKFSISEDSACI
jgi:hypothetical protein